MALVDDLAPHLQDEAHAKETALVMSQYAKSLRMIGEPKRARDVLESQDLSLLSRDAKRQALLNLALAYDTLGDPRAKEIAEEVIKLGKTEPAALHAQAIIVQLAEVGEARFVKLRELEDQAKRKKYKILASTIALIRAETEDLDEEETTQLLEDVLNRSRESKDFYNGVRAIVKMGKMKRGRGLTNRQKLSLVNAYRFLFNERLASLFDDCHSALWVEFDRSADVENLLRIFRHSSLIWRLRDADDREEKYAKQLAKKVKPTSNIASMLPRETAYFLARAGALLVDGVIAARRAAKGRAKRNARA